MTSPISDKFNKLESESKQDELNLKKDKFQLS
jgi:hypothetical protein